VGTQQSTDAGARVLARLEDVVGTMLERILEEEPAYRRLSPAELADVTALLVRNSRLMASSLSGHRVQREQLVYVSEHVRNRVRVGIPLEAVLQAYRTAMNVFWEETTAEVATLGMSRDAAVELARRMSDAMDTLTTHAAATYVREESHLRALSDKAARDLLDALLRGDVGEAGRAEPHSAAPGLDPQGDLRVVVGRVSAEDSSLTRALDAGAAALADSLATRRASPLLVVRERAIVAVVAAEPQDQQIERLTSARADLLAATGIALYCGISSPCSGFAAVAGAYEQASLAVSRASDARPVVSLLALPALQHLLTGATATTRALLLEKAAVLTGSKPEATATLRATLHGFADADMNVTRAAAALHIHENTLRYRLRRVRERSGHDPQTFDGLVELICLLEVLEDQRASR
jgi:PucR-like helix-turn-helix protein/diguanylate cyclase with GGDEF domain